MRLFTVTLPDFDKFFVNILYYVTILKLFFSVAGCVAVKFCVNFNYFKLHGAFTLDL